ncbi:hypothetical protein MBRA1_000039 [Malassezia brasiliensis]|uniref:Uncharacterized protein n=1 Tax=Malassezia brasiliensis TaxID=1821822 RepID=A0AAF0ILV7_9BASI|nr:hypothetical protein MBRA1_000039 [Malassezia brasiliensis]
MAKQIEAAGEGESLLGSDDSSDEAHLAEEEKYIIDDELHRSNHHRQEGTDGKSEDSYRSESVGTEEELNIDHDSDFWNALSPAAHGTDADIGEEMFKPQRGFATSPEPSFSDFFASSDEIDDGKETGDDEMLTTDEDTVEESDGSSTISSASVSAPLIAHFGASQQLPGDAEGEHVNEPDADEEKSLKNAIPLLVIEDLDGRLIYARAGDGEAVFGSDGEFEFVGESEDDSSSDDLYGGTGYGFTGDSSALPHPSRTPGASDTQTYDAGDDGDTTDELPDEDMPPTKGAMVNDMSGPTAHGSDTGAAVSHNNDATTSCCKPEMGQFIPALSKSVHPKQ